MSNSNSNSIPSYQDLIKALDQTGSHGTPAETHGLLSAFFACDIKLKKTAWLNSLQTDTSHSNISNQSNQSNLTDAEKVLGQLFDITQSSLIDNLEDNALDFEFDLILPDSSEAFEDRASATAEWCQGFVSGLGLLGVDLNAEYESNLSEALQDLIKISCLNPKPDLDVSESENDANLLELAEYIRVAVMLIQTQSKVLLDHANTKTRH